MRLRVDFSPLETLVRTMGAGRSVWRLDAAGLSGRERTLAELAEGKEIHADEVSSRGGLLEHEGEQVLLYIKDTRATRETLLNEPENTRRFHVAECNTLDQMRRGGRFQRYHVTRRFDGKFRCAWIDPDTKQSGEEDAELKVCKNCLEFIGWKEYKSRDHDQSAWENFDIAEFLRSCEPVFYAQPERNESNTITPGYVNDWWRISAAYREARGWRCEECNVDLSQDHGLLHAHHIDGNRDNNRHNNLRALCVLCHSKQPMHQHMKVNTKERIKIEGLRIMQGSKPHN
ncbi:HNH endonuclease signature motif containing protein [Martelella mangrovi]|uniref:HNH nuclease domain-containing protein n=1 Tax=Martelella mangrovi TaxID=1397477 RepID=A0ABV2IGS9_9HYPH